MGEEGILLFYLVWYGLVGDIGIGFKADENHIISEKPFGSHIINHEPKDYKH